MTRPVVDADNFLLQGLVDLPEGRGQLRALAAVTTGVVETARWRHDLYPTAAAALGRTLTASLLMGALLKGDQRVLLQIIGDGPLKHVVAAADAQGAVRGYVGDPHVHLPLSAKGKLDVAAAVGRGHLYVTRDFGLREPYRGVVPLVSGEIAEDVAVYFARSEQIPSIVALGVLVDTDNAVRAAGGLLVQVMPGVAPDVIEALEERAGSLASVSQLVDDGADPAELLRQVLTPWPLKLLERRSVRFACSCSRERFGGALAALGEAELCDLIETQGQAELVCHFCGETYRFAEGELAAIVDDLRRPVQ